MIRRTEAAGDQLKLTFVLPSAEPSGPVSVVGTFNDWTPGATLLVRRANGTRSASVTLPKGSRLAFRYLGDGDYWFDDPDADEVNSEGSIINLAT